MKLYAISIEWNYKATAREMRTFHRIKAATLRAAVGKALAIKRPGWRDTTGVGRSVTLIATPLGAVVNLEDADGKE